MSTEPVETPVETPAEPPVESHLVYVDVDDEITSAATRIRATTAPGITLVLPYGSRLATSRINFRLLAREAAERGKRLEIVCADPSARALASAAGLPVHASVAAYERHRAGATDTAATTPPPGEAGAEDASSTVRTGLLPGIRLGGSPRGAAAGAGAAGAAAGAAAAGAAVGERDADTATRPYTVPRRSTPRVPRVGPARPPVRTKVAVGVGVSVIALVLAGGLLAFQVLPSATIVVNPRSEDLGPFDLVVEARTDVTAPDPAGLTIPAQLILFELNASTTLTATGTKVTETKATGNVTFSNFDTGRGVLVPAGTIVKTDTDIEFETLAEVTLPRATFDFFPPFPVHPSTSSVGVQALVAGETGNVGNNAITEVPKAKNTLQVTNPEATGGGAHTESPQVTQADVDDALIAIDEALRQDLDRQLTERTGVPPEVTLFAQTTAVGEATYVDDPATLIGSEGTQFELEASAQGSVLGVDPAPLDALARARLAARVREGWTLDPGSVEPFIGEPTVVGSIVTYTVTIGGTQVHDVDRAALQERVKGLVVADARAVLVEVGDVQITVWPDWVTTIPENDDRITFTVAEPRPAPSPTP